MQEKKEDGEIKDYPLAKDYNLGNSLKKKADIIKENEQLYLQYQKPDIIDGNYKKSKSAILSQLKKYESYKTDLTIGNLLQKKYEIETKINNNRKKLENMSILNLKHTHIFEKKLEKKDQQTKLNNVKIKDQIQFYKNNRNEKEIEIIISENERLQENLKIICNQKKYIETSALLNRIIKIEKSNSRIEILLKINKGLIQKIIADKLIYKLNTINKKLRENEHLLTIIKKKEKKTILKPAETRENNILPEQKIKEINFDTHQEYLNNLKSKIQLEKTFNSKNIVLEDLEHYLITVEKDTCSKELQLNILKNKQSQNNEKNASISKKQNEYKILENYGAIIGPKGVQGKIFQKKLNLLEKSINEILNVHTDYIVSIEAGKKRNTKFHKHKGQEQKKSEIIGNRAIIRL